MVVIRLARRGAKKRPFYHVVAADKRDPRDGRYIEKLGYFNPIAQGGETPLHIDISRLDHWRSVGAQLSDRVKSLLKRLQKHGSESLPNQPADAATMSQAASPAQATAEVQAEARMAAASDVETSASDEQAVDTQDAGDNA